MSTWLGRFAGVLLVGLTWALDGPAVTADEARRIAVAWDAPAECPSEREVIAKVEALLGAELGSLPEQDLGFEARVAVSGESPTRYSVELHVTAGDTSTERRFEDVNCTLLMEAAALVIALTIDPEKVEARRRGPETPEDVGKTPALNPPADASSPVSLPSRSEAPPRREPPRTPQSKPAPITAASSAQPASDLDSGAQWGSNLASLGARFEAAAPVLLGVTSPAAFGLEAGLGLTFESSWYVLGTGDYWFMGAEAISSAPEARIELAGAGGRVRLCHAPMASGWGFEGCAGVFAASISAQGVALSPSRNTRGLWWGPFLEFGWTVRLTRGLGVRSALFGGPSVSRPRFGVVAESERVVVVEPKRAFGGAAVGLVYWVR